jgi:hypothetical protein
MNEPLGAVKVVLDFLHELRVREATAINSMNKVPVFFFIVLFLV